MLLPSYIKMPNMSGFEICNEIINVDCKLKVIFLTALEDSDGYNEFKRQGSPKLGVRDFVQRARTGLFNH
jgi:response regulator RpfG family c-di-GMP phosphodiesterase